MEVSVWIHDLSILYLTLESISRIRWEVGRDKV